MSALTVSGLEAGYVSTPVISGLDLAVDKGEVLALLGPNGVGKTTLFKTLTGLLPTRQGRVEFGGREWTTQGPEARVRSGLVLVPEGRRLFRSLTVADNLRVGWLLRRGAVDPDAIYQVFPRLQERADVKAGSLSGGEQQMLAVGRAMLTQPEVVLVDEPSLGLAPMTAQVVVGAIRRLADGGTAVVMAEQNLRLAMGVADRAIVMRSGQIVYDGECRSTEGRELVEQAYRDVTALDAEVSAS